ncbi:MAG: type II toxin-antitoxin system RelE/ParE family toxin [Gammaproteobacteria bacterium]|nr:type II toxin-antitoxin system RelE/ParE family toxin [Gammaproteobacteria bacterium]MYK69272.1 type II toxin-antitoxin system RelE/ParE family toxin [Gammaproteobacteria bacterium]
MIESFGDDATEALFHGRGRARRIPEQLRERAVRRLDMLNAADSLRDLRSPPGNRLEQLRGDLRGLYSIRINEQWRIVFRWESGNASGVSIVDYHT